MASLPAPISGQSYVMTFADSFGSPDWDQDPATKGTIKWWNWEQCCMTTTNGTSTQTYPDAAGVDPYAIGVNGTKYGLNIKLTEKDNTWVTGVLASTNAAGTEGFSQTYGYFDIEAKMSAGSAIWLAFWFQSPNNLAQDREVDMEFYGSTPTDLYYTLQDWTGCGCIVAQDQETGLPNLTQGFHNYGMLWTSQTIGFYIDNRLQWSTATPSNFDSPMEMMLDNGVGNGQSTSGQASGADFQIAYVQAYAPEGSSAATPIATSAPLNGPLNASAVAEPSTWALTLSGFAILGLAAYRSTRRSRRLFALGVP